MTINLKGKKMEMKKFSQYIQNKSFDKELHKVRKESLERILSTESLTEKKLKRSKSNQLKQTA